MTSSPQWSTWNRPPVTATTPDMPAARSRPLAGSRVGDSPTLRPIVLAALLGICIVLGTPWAPGASASVGQGDDPSDTTDTTVPAESTVTSASVVTTSTLPESNTEFGRIIPEPNSGAEPQTPGDPGGWQQLALFLLVCAVILGMAGWVWHRSRVRRDRRRAAGQDPLDVARRSGGDVRGPRPPGIVD